MACYVFNFNLHDLNLVEIGKQKCTPLYSFGPFIRNEYIFHYVISGKGFCSMGHDVQESSVQKPDQPSGGPTAHEVRAGEGFLIEPHTKHIYNADLNDPCTISGLFSAVPPLHIFFGPADFPKQILFIIPKILQFKHLRISANL